MFVDVINAASWGTEIEDDVAARKSSVIEKAPTAFGSSHGGIVFSRSLRYPRCALAIPPLLPSFPPNFRALAALCVQLNAVGCKAIPDIVFSYLTLVGFRRYSSSNLCLTPIQPGTAFAEQRSGGIHLINLGG